VDLHLRPHRPATPDHRRRRRGGLTALATAVAICASMLAFTGSASALDGNRTGPLDRRGFPGYYVDEAGRTLQLCDDGSRRCQRVEAGDLRAPDGEAVYWAALATVRSKRGPIDVEFALEAAFNGRRPVVFSRIRIRGHLRRPAHYVLEHPYGDMGFVAINPDEQRNVDKTVDARCSLDRGRCAPNRETWLRSVNRPRGYLGGQRRTRVTGGTVRNSLVLRTRQGEFLGRTNRFRVIGKLCGAQCRSRFRR
jgi:hypothetical protein